MSLLRGKAPYRDHLLCRTEEDLDGLLDEHREAAEALIAESEWPGFQHLVAVCVDEETEELVGVTSSAGDEVLFLVVEDRQGEGIGRLMVEAMIQDLPEGLTEEQVIDEDHYPPWSAIAGSEEGASFLASLPNKFGWKAFALIEWSGYDEEKEHWKQYFEGERKKPRELPPLWNDHQFAELVIYRWADGSDAVLHVDKNHGEVLLEVRWVFLPRTWVDPTTGENDFPSFAVDGPTESGGYRYLTLSQPRRFPDELERKVVGLFLDLGVERPGSSPTLVRTQFGHDEVVASYPRFVPDDRWANRYAEAMEARRPGGIRPYLGVIDRLHIAVGSYDHQGGTVYREKEQSGYTAMYGPNLSKSTWGRDIDTVVDNLLANELVLPESQREEWEREHVERGTLVAPTPEEMALYNVLGEACPLWWETEKVVTWIEERSP